MNDTPSRTPGMSRLRDYGALQADISTLATRKMASVSNAACNQATPDSIIVFSALRPGNRVIPASRGTVEESYQPPRPKLGGAIKIIPFHTADMRIPTSRLSPGHQQQAVANVQRTTKKKRLSFALRLGLTLLLFAFLSKSISWSTLWNALLQMQFGMVFVSLTVGACGIVLSAYQWRSLLQGEGIRLDLAKLINLYVVGIAFSHFLPTGMGGDAIKAFYVGRDSGNSPGSASAVVLCRVTGFVGMLVVAAPALLIWHNHFTVSLITTFVLLSLLVGGMISGAIIAVTWLPRLLGSRAKWRVFAKVAQVGNALLVAMKRPRSMGLGLVYGIVFWLVAILNCYAYGDALGIHVPSSFYIVVVPLIALVSFLPISINGFGLRESAYVYAFATMHVAPASALLLALLLDTQALLFGIMGGCVYFTLSAKAKMARLRQAA